MDEVTDAAIELKLKTELEFHQNPYEDAIEAVALILNVDVERVKAVAERVYKDKYKQR